MTELIDPFRYTTSELHDKPVIPLKLNSADIAQRFGLDYWSLGKDVAKKYKEAIHQRDFNVCQICGFQSDKYQELLVPNNKEWQYDDVVTACVFCSQCLSMNEVGNMRSGVLLYLPEIPQDHLNRLARIIYVCRISQGEQAEKSRSLLDKLMKRREKAKSLLTDDPAILMRKFRSIRSKTGLDQLNKVLKDFRLFPLDRRIITESDLEFNQFPQILAFWRSKAGPFGGLTPKGMDLDQFDEIDRLLDKSKTSK